MQTARTQRPLADGVSAQSVRRHLEKLLASRVFASAAQLSRLLRFLVDEAIRDSAMDLTEQHIGREVFGKPDSFDPRTDPIVRVEACRLRARLKKYYTTTGARDRLIIELPPRSYAPAFWLVPARNESSPSKMGPQTTGNSIVILPFTSFGKWSESFNRGFIEELIPAINDVGRVRVFTWHAGLPSSAHALGPRELARCFGVGRMLDGSIRRSHNMVRVSVRLISVQDASVFWSRTYAAPIRDVMDLQKQIAGEVAQAITVPKRPPGIRLVVLGGTRVPA